jgi:hypothetical protein
MKFFLINGGSGKIQYPDFRIPQDNAWFKEKRLPANKWIDRSLPLPIPMNANNKYKPDDYPQASTKLVSQKVFECIKKLNQDYEALPTQIFYKGEKLYDLFYSMFFPEYPVINFKESDYEADEDDATLIWMLNKLVLDRTKIDILPSENNIFCVQELSTRIVCTEIAKNTFEKAGVVGMNFEELDIR